MDQPLAVCMIEGGGNLGEEAGRPWNGEWAAGSDQSEQTLAGNKLHRDVVDAAMHSHLKRPGNVGMGHPLTQLHFAPKAGQVASLSTSEGRRQDLERHQLTA